MCNCFSHKSSSPSIVSFLLSSFFNIHAHSLILFKHTFVNITFVKNNQTIKMKYSLALIGLAAMTFAQSTTDSPVTATVTNTQVSTITSCAPEKTDCPAYVRFLFTVHKRSS